MNLLLSLKSYNGCVMHSDENGPLAKPHTAVTMNEEKYVFYRHTAISVRREKETIE